MNKVNAAMPVKGLDFIIPYTIAIYIYIYIYSTLDIFTMIFRYMTCEITHHVLHKLITLVVIETGQTFQFSWFLQLPSSGAPTQPS